MSTLSRALGHELVPDDAYPASDLLGEGFHAVLCASRGAIRFRRAPWSGLVLLESGTHLTSRGSIEVGRNVRLRRSAVINARGGHVSLGDSCVLGRHTILEASSTMRYRGGDIAIGPRSSIADFCYVGGAGGVRIGAGVMVGQFVSFHSENHLFEAAEIDIRSQGVQRQGIEVDDDCWIGAGARILDGVRLGRGTIVAAGAVVTRSTGPREVVAGVPARVIRSR